MPCFHGLAVSIHTLDGPLPEYSIQKQARQHRITSYIAVPAARVRNNSTTNKPEQSNFAISITLLTPGLNVPYSAPKPTPEDSYPRSKVVGGLPGQGGKYGSVIGPYVPLTSSQNETIAAYIYFDGRAKEEVATLLRRGEETWVNSRWVSLPESEGGGLAEREFLFREVGLERWLNGLDLEGKDAAATIEKRRERLEKKQRRKREQKEIKMDSDDETGDTGRRGSRNGVLRYGDDENAPLESLSGDENLFTSDSDSEDEPPMPEAAGQIKVALFRVLASGEIKRGEYSPQFKAHDDEEGGNEDGNGDADHTTSFAQPKTLDPKSISTQTVTGIDPPDKPYAVFTFLYRGEKQLQKMGILPKPDQEPKTPATKRASRQLDFTNLKPLDSKTGTKGFAGYRDAAVSEKERKKAFGKKGADDMDSDADDDEDGKLKDADDADDIGVDGRALTHEDFEQQGEVAEAIRKMKLKRQHSGEALDAISRKQTGSGNPSAAASPSPGVGLDLSLTPTTTNTLAGSSEAVKNVPSLATDLPPGASIGSPFKKHRASLPATDGAMGGLNAQLMGARSATARLKAETSSEGASAASNSNSSSQFPSTSEQDIQ